ncbi:MAG: rhomboid family intramembrane serine protease [Phycisphaerales bacterium]|nr:rhomboid family intramembrane serine protease [Phycisphaerales bacterium]
MGVSDRDYIRNPPPGRGYGAPMPRMGWRAMSGWSVNTWIIVICALVFVVDSLIPSQTYFPVGGPRLAAGVTEIPDTAKIIKEAEVARFVEQNPQTNQTVIREALAWPIKDVQTGQTVALQEVRPYQAGLLNIVFHFSTAAGFLRLEVWRLVTFQFLHAGIGHIFLNMLGLYFFGPMVEQHLGSRRYLAYYLICGIAGAILYLILNFLGSIVGLALPFVPVLINDPWTPLVGASAGVYGVLMAGAFIAPNTVVQLIFPPIPLRLKTLAYILLGIALFTLFTQGDNAGGQAAHIGGAVAGYFFIRRPALLHDFLDFRGGPKKQRRSRPSDAKKKKKVDDDAIDRILSKVATQGLQSLTESEKRLLQRASEEKRSS